VQLLALAIARAFDWLAAATRSARNAGAPGVASKTPELDHKPGKLGVGLFLLGLTGTTDAGRKR
jgi:hypothetical protein